MKNLADSHNVNNIRDATFAKKGNIWRRQKTIVFLTVLVFLTFKNFNASADIIPEPVVVKGIVPLHPVNIQMTSEIVKVNLTLDSSIVECTFNMRNLGNAQDMEIGFPIMNFYLWDNDYLSPLIKDKFEVFVKNKKLSKIDFYIPNQLKNILTEVESEQRYSVLSNYENENRPWYLWKMHFGNNENLSIVVKYRLPNGATKGNSFFNYLLSTGAGWKGKILNAKVIVSVVNIPSDQVISLSPKSFVKKDSRQIVWEFNNLKPTLKDDIEIKYERTKGEYKEHQRKLNAELTYVDGKRTMFTSILKMTNLGAHKFNQHPRQLHYFTNGYILREFKKNVKKINKLVWQQISKESVFDFENKYQLEINGDQISKDILFRKIYEVDTMKIKKVEIKKTKSEKNRIIVISN